MSKHFGKYKFSSSFLQFYYQPSWLFSFLNHYNCIRNARVKTIVYEFYLSMIRNLKKWWPLNTSHANLNCSIWFSIQIVLHVCVCVRVYAPAHTRAHVLQCTYSFHSKEIRSASKPNKTPSNSNLCSSLDHYQCLQQFHVQILSYKTKSRFLLYFFHRNRNSGHDFPEPNVSKCHM